MAYNNNTDFFMGVLKEKQTQLVVSLTSLSNALVSGDVKKRVAAIKVSLDTVNVISSIVPKTEVPRWLELLRGELTSFSQSVTQVNSEKINKYLFIHFMEIKGYQWDLEKGIEAALDFDGIFEKHKAENKLPELFDDIIKILEEISASNAIDGRAMSDALKKVTATIKISKDGSHSSINQCWQFLLDCFEGYLWAELSRLPVVGQAFEALEKAINAADKGLFQVNLAVKNETDREVASEINALDYAKEYKQLTYSKDGSDIPSMPELKAISIKA